MQNNYQKELFFLSMNDVFNTNFETNGAIRTKETMKPIEI